MSDVDVVIGELITETPDAWLVEVADDKQVWLLKSQCEYDDKVTWTVPEWLAEKKDLL